MTHEELKRRFKHHAPDQHKIVKHELMRQDCLSLAIRIVDSVPDCREQSVALTKLEEVMFWANAAIARPAPGA